MISTNATGAAVYAAVQGNAAGGMQAGADQSFGSVLQGALGHLTDLGQAADAKAAQAMTGGGNMTDVVMAVSKAEMALQASVAVRDKVISAYQDIMRMSV